MSYRTYQAVARAARERAAIGDVDVALDILSREAPAFPLYTGVAALARAKLLVRAGDAAEAIRSLEQALDAGYRIRREWLADPELAPLASDRHFVELATRAETEYALAVAVTKPDLRIVPPRGDEPSQGFPVLVVLHGNNSNFELTAPYWTAATDQGWLLALAQSREVGSAPGTFLWADRDYAASELAQHLQVVRGGFTIDERRVVLAGFSGGATMALGLTLTARFAARGVIAVAAYLPVIGEFTRRIQGGAAAGLRTYLVVGEADESGHAGTAGLAAVLTAQGLPVHLETHRDLGHEYPDDMPATIGAALSFVAPP